MSSDLGRRLFRVRMAKGLSLRDMENILGISTSGIAAIEKGRAKPRPETAFKIESWLLEVDTPLPDTTRDDLIIQKLRELSVVIDRLSVDLEKLEARVDHCIAARG